MEAIALDSAAADARGLPKAPTGVQGLDEITEGGLPRGRPTLVCGSAGCGKTLLAIEFLVRGAVEYGEPGVLMTFEETAEELAQNVRSLGFDLDALIEKVIQADSREQLDVRARALDRVLRAKQIWVPNWSKAAYWVAYWDVFGRPAENPPYARGDSYWWFDQAKYDKLKAEGALR